MQHSIHLQRLMQRTRRDVLRIQPRHRPHPRELQDLGAVLAAKGVVVAVAAWDYGAEGDGVHAYGVEFAALLRPLLAELVCFLVGRVIRAERDPRVPRLLEPALPPVHLLSAEHGRGHGVFELDVAVGERGVVCGDDAVENVVCVVWCVKVCVDKGHSTPCENCFMYYSAQQLPLLLGVSGTQRGEAVDAVLEQGYLVVVGSLGAEVGGVGAVFGGGGVQLQPLGVLDHVELGVDARNQAVVVGVRLHLGLDAVEARGEDIV